MHLEHEPGDKLFIDFAGNRLPIVDPSTGEVRYAEVFVATLEYSQYTYVEALASQTKPLGAQARMALLEIIEDRHGRASTIIASQLPVENWHETIGDGSVADAILDRIVHKAHRIKLSGQSLRKIK